MPGAVGGSDTDTEGQGIPMFLLFWGLSDECLLLTEQQICVWGCMEPATDGTTTQMSPKYSRQADCLDPMLNFPSVPLCYLCCTCGDSERRDLDKNIAT